MRPRVSGHGTPTSEVLPPIIESVHAWEAFDARGWPAVGAAVRLAGGVTGRATAPGSIEDIHYGALQLRDGDYTRHRGRGVRNAVRLVTETLAARLTGRRVERQQEVDGLLSEAPGEAPAANATLAVSLAAARAVAAASGTPLWRHLGQGDGPAPHPIFDLMTGGQRYTPGLDFRGYLVVANTAASFGRALEQGFAVSQGLRDWIVRSKLPLTRPEFGAFAPGVKSNREALDLLLKAIDRAGLAAGKDVSLGLDVGARLLYDVDDERYFLGSEARALDTGHFLAFLQALVRDYPVTLLIDPLSPTDAGNSEDLQPRFGDVTVAGYEFFASSRARLDLGVAGRAAGGIAVDLSQTATVTQALAVMGAARDAGWMTIAHAAPGETEDTALADVAVAAGAAAVRFGPLSGAEHLSKYARMAHIEEERRG